MSQRRTVKKSAQIVHHQCTVMLAGEAVACRVSSSVRKSMRLQMTHDGCIDLRMPLSVSMAEGLAFVQQHQHWLLQRRHASLQQQQRWLVSVPLLGRQTNIERTNITRLTVLPERVLVPSIWQAADVQQAMDGWYRQQAREYFPVVIDLWWPHFAAHAQKPQLRVKKMRTRWGSLSQRGYINMNCLLMAMAPDLIELVVVHELCHTRYFDHGRQFQSLMSELLPDWRDRERRLHEQGRLLLSS